MVFDGIFKKIDDLLSILVEKMQVERDMYLQLKETLKRSSRADAMLIKSKLENLNLIEEMNKLKLEKRAIEMKWL